MKTKIFILKTTRFHNIRCILCHNLKHKVNGKQKTCANIG